jgi:amino acid transporter
MSTVSVSDLSVSSEDQEQRQLVRRLSWRGGAIIACSVPFGVLVAVGPSIASLGTWGAIALWGGSALIGLIQVMLFSEMATMFTDKPGISLYAHEAWRKYASFAGPVAAFGYWMGWSLVLSIFGSLLGSLIQAEWFPSATWTVFDGTAHIGLAQIFGAGAIILVWALNVFGIRPAVLNNLAIAVLLAFLFAIFVIGAPIAGVWHPSQLTWKLGAKGQAWGGLKLAIVWLYVMGWTGYASEIAATFTPEYRDPARDSRKALMVAGGATLGAFILIPLMTAGVVGEKAVAAAPYTYFIGVFHKIIGPAGGLVTLLLVLVIFLGMNSATADGSRALYGISRDGLTLRQFGRLNRHHIPGWAMTFDMGINLILLFFVASPLGILFASNLGYFVCVVLALSGFILLRRDRPNWPRSFKLKRSWIVVAGVLAVFNTVLLVIGASNPSLAGYGGGTSVLIGLGLLSLSIVFWVYRRLVQDKAKLVLREEVPAMPVAVSEPAAVPAQTTATE